jgi:hypothetical protein
MRHHGDGTRTTLVRYQAPSSRLETNMGIRRVIRVQPPVPLGDVTLVPAPLCGRAEADMARAMAAALSEFEMPSAADVLGQLRQAFPLAPLGARLAALTVMMERRWRSN